jgi:hypothetical protein
MHACGHVSRSRVLHIHADSSNIHVNVRMDVDKYVHNRAESALTYINADTAVTHDRRARAQRLLRRSLIAKIAGTCGHTWALTSHGASVGVHRPAYRLCCIKM